MVMEIIVVSSSSVSTYSMNPEVTKSFQVYPVSSFSCKSSTFERFMTNF